MEYLDTYQDFNLKKSRKKVRNKAIHMLKQFGYPIMVVKPGRFAMKYASSAPYHLFFTRIEDSKQTYNQQLSITFSEILDCSLGEIVNSLHKFCCRRQMIVFAISVGWSY